uniref:Uncharacterized protein n=1 Tax=Amphimedon queenslandica TaxID=400682 RepID=A0A1X7V2S4_AMPQE
MLFYMLVLQNPIGKPLDSKVAAKYLVRHIELWKTLAFHLFMDECRTIQSRLPSLVSQQSQDKVHCMFSNPMMKVLDKCPGIRPIGIGKTPRRLICKAVPLYFREDINFVG